MEIKWKVSTFGELTTDELYAILKLRQQVFIVEQQCVYQDCDGLDTKAHHLVGWYNIGELPEPIAYLRVIYPEEGSNSTSIGRFLIHPNFRGKGIAREMMAMCLQNIEKSSPKSAVCISAQQYLTHFYETFGFHVSSDGYEEDGIPHIGMTRNSIV
ncbi:MAG: GNAT family N-acetyltransferase [Desulfobulbaceae bacterium]|nr:GNAT family N-acetyltransferase [Desulfobulbaceae bacterium]